MVEGWQGIVGDDDGNGSANLIPLANDATPCPQSHFSPTFHLSCSHLSPRPIASLHALPCVNSMSYLYGCMIFSRFASSMFSYRISRWWAMRSSVFREAAFLSTLDGDEGVGEQDERCGREGRRMCRERKHGQGDGARKTELGLGDELNTHTTRPIGQRGRTLPCHCPWHESLDEVCKGGSTRNTIALPTQIAVQYNAQVRTAS
jgi:hypothetical protein